MKTMIKLTLAASLTLLAFASPASATPGMVIDSNHLSAAVSTDLRTQIGKQRVADAASFSAVHDLAARSRELDAKARGRRAPMALYFKALGNKAVLPLVEMVAFDAPKDVPQATRRDMVEALGLLRDQRAMPVLGAILERETDPHMVRTAAEAVGRMETDESVQRLVSALTSSQGDRQTAVAAGMGACHREAIAKALAMHLASRPSSENAAAAILSLGRAGNAWAWSGAPNRTEEAATRSAAAKALVAAYVAYDGEARSAASDAIMMVDDASTTSLVADAKKGASPEVAKALDALATRFANNPLRTK